MKKILLSAALAALSLNASGKINEGQSYGDWKGACDHGECAVIQIANDANRQPLAQLVLIAGQEADRLPGYGAAGGGFDGRHAGAN